MKTPLNRQGVRNLDLGRNARPGQRTPAFCYHAWEHNPSCMCDYINYSGNCSERCRRCGEVR